jgi:hypothetical protein
MNIAMASEKRGKVQIKCVAAVLVFLSLHGKAFACSCNVPTAPTNENKELLQQIQTPRGWKKYLFEYWLRGNPANVMIASVADVQPEAMTVEQILDHEKRTGIVLPMNNNPRYAMERATAVLLRGSFPKDGSVHGGQANCHQRMSPISEKNLRPKRWIIFANETHETSICSSNEHDEETERVLREVFRAWQRSKN